MRHSTRWYIVNVWTKSKCEGQDYILFAVSLFSTNFIQIYISHRLVSVASFVGLKMWNGNHNGANYTQGRWNEIDELCAHNEKTEKKKNLKFIVIVVYVKKLQDGGAFEDGSTSPLPLPSR